MRYTADELLGIKHDYESGMTPKEIGEKYHRSFKSIDDKLRCMNVNRRGTKIYEFTSEDMDFLKREYPKGNWDAIIQRFPNVPRSKIYRIISDNDITTDSYFWSEHDKGALVEYYGALPVQNIQKMLDRHYSIRLIQSRAQKWD